MKKRDLVLDFTSLLDVIMIILFVVVSNMGQNALNIQAETQKKAEELQNITKKLIQENEDLKKQNEDLKKQNELLSARAGESDITESEVLAALLKKSAQITLDCNTYVDEEKSDSNRVDITIYKSKGTEDQESNGTISFSHNLNLSTEEREAKNAAMQRDMFIKLKNVIEPLDVELVIISIQYKYDDVNFSISDLNNIVGAIEDLERELNITCFVDNIKR